MGTKHRHYDVIVAWANGEKCEFFSPISEKWEPLNPNSVPAFYEDYEYRIKPKRVKKEGWVNVYKWNHCDGVMGYAYKSKECADKHVVISDKVACIHIEWEEEQ